MTKCMDIRKENLPRVLFLSFKRFAYDVRMGITRKINDPVDFPLLWDANVGAEYHLKAVIVHVGPRLREGHYIAYCCNPNRMWYAFDDASASPKMQQSMLIGLEYAFDDNI